MRSCGQGFSEDALLGDDDEARSNSDSHLQGLAGGPCELTDLCHEIEPRVHGAFSIILVSPGRAEKRQNFPPRPPGDAPIHMRDSTRANAVETLNDASEVLGVYID
jgi:hypothetical protein